MPGIALVFISVIFGAIGQVFIKSGALRSGAIEGVSLIKTYLQPNIIIGVGLYAISALIWVLALRKVDLSYAYPMVSFGYVIVVIASYYIFNESLNIYKVAGLAIILTGILVLSPILDMAFYIYIITPFVAWVISGSLKLAINYLRFKRRAFELIGYGGLPSTHTTIVASTVFLLGFKEGFDSPIFGLGVTLLLITIIDAMGLRRALGLQAEAINKYVIPEGGKQLREKQGHSRIEVLAGLVLGCVIGLILSTF